MNKIILIENCNFYDFPKGGQLSFCNQLLDTFPEGYFKLIGVTTTPEEKVGVWHHKIINGKTYEFLPLYYTPKEQIKGIIPSRLRFFISMIFYRKSINLNCNENRIFTHAPESLITIHYIRKNIKVLHFLHGVENPLNMPRYKWAKVFSKPFWKIYINSLGKTDFIAATADGYNINKFIKENKIITKIVSFPTRFDDRFYKYIDNNKSQTLTFVFCGRINFVKGWELLIQSFYCYVKNYGSANLIIIGDGEDRRKLESYINEKNLGAYVKITGFLNKIEITSYLNKAHVFLMPSYKEGWPIALLEALACGLPIVATNVSGTRDLITLDTNGYIVETRDPQEFAHAMFKASKLQSPNKESLKIAEGYKLSGLKNSLKNSFPIFFEYNGE